MPRALAGSVALSRGGRRDLPPWSGAPRPGPPEPPPPPDRGERQAGRKARAGAAPHRRAGRGHGAPRDPRPPPTAGRSPPSRDAGPPRRCSPRPSPPRARSRAAPPRAPRRAAVSRVFAPPRGAGRGTGRGRGQTSPRRAPRPVPRPAGHGARMWGPSGGEARPPRPASRPAAPRRLPGRRGRPWRPRRRPRRGSSCRRLRRASRRRGATGGSWSSGCGGCSRRGSRWGSGTVRDGAARDGWRRRGGSPEPGPGRRPPRRCLLPGLPRLPRCGGSVAVGRAEARGEAWLSGMAGRAPGLQ